MNPIRTAISDISPDIRYGNFWEIVVPVRDGHVSVGVELGADVTAIAERVLENAKRGTRIEAETEMSNEE